jgi:hypothetical protein
MAQLAKMQSGAVRFALAGDIDEPASLPLDRQSGPLLLQLSVQPLHVWPARLQSLLFERGLRCPRPPLTRRRRPQVRFWRRDQPTARLLPRPRLLSRARGRHERHVPHVSQPTQPAV